MGLPQADDLFKLVAGATQGAAGTGIAYSVKWSEMLTAIAASQMITDTELATALQVYGTAAVQDVEYFATAVQGALADTALQDASAFATAAQGTKADTAVQPAALTPYALSANVYDQATIDAALGAKADQATTYTITQVDSALALKADASTIYTQSQVDTALAGKANAADVYTKAETDSAIATLINGAPGLLDTLDEIAAALGDDPDFATTMTNALAGKADIASTLAGYGITNAYTQTETNTQINSAISALNLGTAAQSDPGDFAAASHNHTLSDVLGFGAAGGYIRSNGSGWARVSGIAWGDLTSIPTTVQNIDTELANKANWDTAFGWGDHASGGYLAASSYTAADVLTKLLTVDGAGTGLHADLLDGYEGSYYLDYNNLINKPTGGGTGDAVLADDETITGDWVFSSSLKVADSNAAYYPSGTWKQIISQQQDSAGNHGLSVMTRWGGSDSIIFEAASGWTGGAAQYSRVFNIDGLGVARLFDKSTDIERIKLTPSGYNPGAGIAAIETSGSYGGGIRMVDGAGSWMTWMSASGTVLNIGLPQASGTNNFSTAMTINSVGQIFWGTGVGRMDTNGTIVAQDVYADRGDNTGVIYFGSDASKYLYYSGTDYMLNGANLSVNGTYALLQNGTQTFGPAGGGVKTFHTTDGETIIGGGSAISSLQVMQNTAGTDAAITFHVSGDYAAQFGLCGDINDFAVGGWSMGANRYRIWHEGNLPTDTAATANTVMLRDGNGDTTARYGFATYFNMTHSEAGRYSDTVFYSSYDNFVRKNDAAGMRSSLAVPGLAGDNTFTGNQVIKNTSPTLFFQDIDHDSAMIHVNSSVFYVLRGTGSTTGWTSHSNGRWPMQLGLSATNPYASFAGNIYTVGQYYGGTGTATAPAFSFLDDTNTGVYQNGADHLNFATGGTQRGYWNSTSLYVNDLRQMSDRRAKKKIKDSPYGLKELLQLRPRKYIVKANGTIEIGFIAQEVEEIMPEFVDDGKGSKSSKGMKSLKYAKMVAVMTKAIQELEARVRELEAA